MILRNQLGPVRLPDRAELVAFFSAHRLFRVLPAEVLASVADRVGVRRYPRTHILSYTKEPASSVLVVRSGYIARQEIDSHGRAHVILTCSDGDVIGLGAALRAGRWAWTGLAITDVEVNLVERELFEDLYHRFPDLAVQQQPGGSVLLCKTGRCQRRRIRRLAWRARAVCKPGNARANSATCSDWANSSAQTASATAVSVTHERAPTTSATRLHSNGYTVQ